MMGRVKPKEGPILPAILARLIKDQLVPSATSIDSLRAVAAQEPAGVYTVLRTYHRTQTVRLEAHFLRLEESAGLEGLDIKLDRDRLRTAMRQLIDDSGYGESRLRITIPLDRPGEPVLAIEPLHPVPPELRAHGVKTATVRISRHNPRAKSNAWESARAQALKRLPPDVYEGLLTNDRGEILEGFTSNVYAVQGQAMLTPDSGMLRGISRQILLDVLPANLHLIHRPIQTADLPALDECFLTSSSRGVIPIIQIDDSVIGDGEPGHWTQSLESRYHQWVDEHLEQI